jgi:flagellar hook-associated protein 3
MLRPEIVGGAPDPASNFEAIIMIPRITQQFASAAGRGNLQRQTAELFKVQQQISSGLRVQRPSDDPAAMRQSLIQSDRIEKLNSHTTSLKQVRSRLSSAEVQLGSAANMLLRARDIALSSQQTTFGAETTALVRELEGILQGLKSVANASDETGYLFSGTAAGTEPFPVIDQSTGASKYAGTSDNTQLHLTGDIPRNALLSGDQIFQATSRGPTIISGTTGAALGTGTDSARGIRQLQVTHGTTSYAAGSGIAVGTSSASGDTIIGAAGTHSVRIVDTSGTGASGTISLNGGPEIAWTSADVNLQVTGSKGEKIFVNTSSITAGFSGDIDITATGSMSIDGGTTSTPIDFSENQQLIDSGDGSAVFLDTRKITRTGTDQLEFVGTADIFAAVNNLKLDIQNARNLSPSERSAALARRLEDLELIHDHLIDVKGIQGVAMEQLDRLSTRTEDLVLAEKIELNDTIAADFTQAVIRMQELTNLQQYTIAAVSRSLSTNLLNYLQ